MDDGPLGPATHWLEAIRHEMAALVGLVSEVASRDLTPIVNVEASGGEPGAIAPFDVSPLLAAIREIPAPVVQAADLGPLLEKLDEIAHVSRGLGSVKGGGGPSFVTSQVRNEPGQTLHVTVDAQPAGSSGLTNTELRATPVPVSGTVAISNPTANPETGLAKDATFTKDVDGGIKTHVQNFPASQAVTATSLPLPAGAATDATLTGGTARAKITDGTNNVGVAGGTAAVNETLTDRLKVNAELRLLDTAQASGSQLVAAKGDQATGLWVNIKNASVPTNVSNFPATQAVSLATNTPDVTDRAARLLGHVTVDNASLAVTAAALPLPAGAATDTSLTGGTQRTKITDGTNNAALAASAPVGTEQGLIVRNIPSGTQPVSLSTNTPDVTDRAARLLGHVTVDNASLAVTGTVTGNQGTPAALSNAWPVKNTDGTNTAAVKAASTAAVAADPALTVALSPNSPVVQAALTKGTQGTTGVTTQDLKDAGRAAKTMLAAFTSTALIETAISFQVASAFGAPAVAAANYTVTAGKTLRIQHIYAAMRAGGSTPAASLATFKMKVGGNQQGIAYTVACPVTVAAGPAAFPGLPLIVPDGLELPAASVLSFTLTLSAWTAVTNTPIVDLTVIGYEY